MLRVKQANQQEEKTTRRQEKIEIGLLAEINLAAQDAHRAEHGQDDGGKTQINHLSFPFL